MAKPFDFGEIQLSVGGESQLAAPQPDTPFRIAVLGDFKGNGSPAKGSGLKAILVDRDNFDEVLAAFAPELLLPFGDSVLSLSFRELDDFHPDRLFQNASIFRRLRDVRKRLEDPDTFSEAAAQLGFKSAPAPPQQPKPLAPSARDAAAEVIASGSLLDAMVAADDSGAAAVQPARMRDPIRDFVQQVTAPHLVAKADPRQAELIAAIDLAMSAQMRALLHAPAFQALEATWRSVFFLVRHIETGPQLKLYLIDASRPELSADLISTPDLRQTKLYKLLVEKTVGTPGADSWSLLLGTYAFAADVAQIELLGRLAKIASAAGASFLASGMPTPLLGLPCLVDLLGLPGSKQALSDEAVKAWAALRAKPEAAFVGLALPRFLLRLPYGKKTDSVEAFDFEEMPDTIHEDYLWGNPAFACVALLAESFSDEGWDMRPGSRSEVSGLPLHTHQSNGEWEVKPCSEVLMTENTALQILEQGLMPLVTLKGTDTVKLLRFQSIAEPLQALAGPWTR